ncbi:MAG: hypothetical protein ACHQJ6_05480 [Candidatus Berkiellales bacterium]
MLYIEFWQAKWENKDTRFNQEKPNPFLIKYIDCLNLKSGARIFFPLCGKSIGMLWFAKRGNQIMGVKLRTFAREGFFKDHKILFHESQAEHFKIISNDNITLLTADIFNLNNDLVFHGT